jgi:alpha-ribazole phosphatase
MELIVWRHPRPKGVQGRCIGQMNVPVDRRKAKRLAHRIRQYARRQRLFEREPAMVWTSPLRRCFDVGRILRGWGWGHRVDARLSELNFGDWDGRFWAAIAKADVDAWCDNFADAQPGGGESVRQLLARCGEFVDERRAVPTSLVVAHAGWINALRWVSKPQVADPIAANWPTAIAYSNRFLIGDIPQPVSVRPAPVEG